jgi:hypothetical protein
MRVPWVLLLVADGCGRLHFAELGTADARADSTTGPPDGATGLPSIIAAASTSTSGTSGLSL